MVGRPWQSNSSGIPPSTSDARWLNIPLRLAMGMLLAVLCGFGAMGALNVLSTHHDIGVLVLCLVLFGGVFLLQLVHSAQRTRALRDRYGKLTLCAQGVLTFAPLMILGVLWGGMAGFLAGSVLLVLRGMLSWILFALVAAANGTIAILSDLSTVDSVYIVLSTMLFIRGMRAAGVHVRFAAAAAV